MNTMYWTIDLRMQYSCTSHTSWSISSRFFLEAVFIKTSFKIPPRLYILWREINQHKKRKLSEGTPVYKQPFSRHKNFYVHSFCLLCQTDHSSLMHKDQARFNRNRVFSSYEILYFIDRELIESSQELYDYRFWW